MTRRRIAEPCALALLALAVPAIAVAQPAAPTLPAAPSAPAPPALPAAPPMPAAPSAPSLPAAPSLPPAPSAAAPAAPSAQAKPGAAGATPPASSPPEDAEIILEGQTAEPAAEGLPATLPRELQRNASPQTRAQLGDKKGALTIEEIVNSPVVSASRRKEGALSAPAFVIVITAKDLHDRGYNDLSQVLDDLPGMDVIRPYGDVYVKSYWRGYRPGAGADPYLVLIDGVVFNSLFYGDAQILAAFPISNVDHVEVLYGPASAVYGPDAAMGIINVITKDGAQQQTNGELGSSLTSKFTFGGPQRNLSSFADSTKLADASFQYITKDFRLRVTSRFENSVLDTSIGNEFEYTKPSYYSDPRLWGSAALAAYPNISGQFRSPDQKRAVDARLYVGNTEVAAQYFSLSTGLGTRYAADRFQTSTPWTSTEASLYARHTANLSESVNSTTFLQYRSSNVSSPSSYLQSAYSGSGPLTGAATFAAVVAPNSAVVFQQDFDVAAGRNLLMDSDALSVELGAKYQHFDFSQSYATITDTVYPVNANASAVPTSGILPGSPAKDGSNGQSGDAMGAYVLGKYEMPHGQSIDLGARADTPPLIQQVEPTVRGGYVGTFDDVVIKALYGQAAYAPGPYDINAAKALGHPAIRPERSQTIEGDADGSFWKLALHGDVWFVDYTDPIINGVNMSVRQMSGFDMGVHFLLPPIKVWAYYSRYINAKESTSTSGGVGPIGDLAYNKIWGGVTVEKGPLMATLLGRYVDGRNTVSTNPIGHVPAYYVLDANVVASHLFVEPLWASFRVTNILDRVYYEPGMQTAGSGDKPGVYTGATYVGSQDSFNSLLPQPRRAFFLSLGLDL